MNSCAALLVLSLNIYLASNMLFNPQTYVCSKGYPFSFTGGIQALEDGVEEGNAKKVFHALNFLDLHDYNANTKERLRQLCAEWKGKSAKIYEEDWTVEDEDSLDDKMLWRVVILKYDAVERGDVIEYLNEVKGKCVGVDGSRMGYWSEKFLWYVRTKLGIDVFPCYVSALLNKHTQSVAAPGRIFEDLVKSYADRLTQPILAGIAQTHRDNSTLLKEVDKLAKEKFKVTTELLLKEKVSVDDIRAAVAIQEWPQNAVPARLPLRDSDWSMSNEAKLIKDRGYWVSTEGYVKALKDSLEGDDFVLMSAALKSIRQTQCTDTFKNDIIALAELLRKKYKLGDLPRPGLVVQWGERLSLCDVIEPSEWRICLKASKRILLGGEDPECYREAAIILRRAVAKKKVDGYPCLMGVVMHGVLETVGTSQGKFNRTWNDVSAGILGCIERRYDDRLTKAVLVACLKKDSTDQVCTWVGMIARRKFGLLSSDLLKENVDTEAIIKSLNLDAWPDNAMLDENESRETLN